MIGPELKDLKRNNDEIAEVCGRHVARKDDGTRSSGMNDDEIRINR